ncbi:hypothetical protein PYW07_001176 [Mythimna separata]|uniref:Transmembrane and coiled-coil domain-containing protein 7 n=1 Tax=Mythimna separata TaxID=271217 RepID=A0AAD7YUH6_MYTSE|nr:hypothetical protein PYW07_001176 [Mythimna separata]
MSQLQPIFNRIEKLTHAEGYSEFVSLLKDISINENEFISNDSFLILKSFLQKIISAIDELAAVLRDNETILISVRNQKLLRTCFQLISSLGISPCLIPGLGIKLSKRCVTGTLLPNLLLTDEQKYEMLVNCTDFITRSYCVSALKTVIITLHLSDYLAALIQLSFAPFKKPGMYNNFIMTLEMYEKLNEDRKKYLIIYNHLVNNCFQPVLMKELLVLHSSKDPSPPAFAKRVIAKELSQRLIAPGGLLSLIKCFIESYNIDTGLEWKKIDMICRIIAARHGSGSESDYLTNICSQLQGILSLHHTYYLAAAGACVLNLYDKFPQATPVVLLVEQVFQAFDYNHLTKNSNLPGTIILTPLEVEQKINVLHTWVCSTKLDWPVQLLIQNLYLIYCIGVKCKKHNELKGKLKDIIIKTLEKIGKEELLNMIKSFLFGKDVTSASGILIEEFDAGVAIKSVSTCEDYQKEEAVMYFMDLFRSTTDDALVTNIFSIALKILIDLNDRRRKIGNKEILFSKDDPVLINETDQQYAIILQLLSEISASPKIVNSLKTNPMIVSDFIEHFLLNQNIDANDECVTIALVLLNTILSNSDKVDDKFSNLIPVLTKIGENDSSLNSILCKEALSLISEEAPQKKDTACEKAIADTFDELLPVRAHGIIELTKLVDAGDTETLSKKHYIFCIFQEQLKDPDSYIYLSAVNGLASLCTHCTEDVLQILCKEFLQDRTMDQKDIRTNESQNKEAELRMKIGDVIVKVTKRLGEMAIVHKTILLNTMLCAVNDSDPLIRTSALSNLAEIALVLHYRIGTIIYEVLYCIWSIIETDKAIECRRAAVMVISSLIKGLGRETLLQLKDNLLHIYRTLKNLYRDEDEDTTVRLHAQIALEELNGIVNQFLSPEVKMEKQIFVLDKAQDLFK